MLAWDRAAGGGSCIGQAVSSSPESQGSCPARNPGMFGRVGKQFPGCPHFAARPAHLRLTRRPALGNGAHTHVATALIPLPWAGCAGGA